MLRILKQVTLASVLLFCAHSKAAIIPIELDTAVDDFVVGDSAWINENTFGEGLDFFVLNLSEMTDLSLQITSQIAFGISVYAGEITNDFGILFNNDADFSDFFTDLSFVDGVSSLLPGFGNPAFLTTLDAGIYTIAVGGNEGFFDDVTQFAYSFSVSDVSPAAEVNAPNTMFALALLIMVAMVLRKQQQE